MPTKGEMPHSSLVTQLVEPSRNWTDDLPVCHLSGMGLSVNQIYRKDGLRNEAHEYEDTSFHFKVEDKEIYFYGVFNGSDGSTASHFAAHGMPAEVLLDQLDGKETDKEITDVLLHAFHAVEKNFFGSIDDLLAEKANLQLQIQGLNEFAAFEKYPDIIRKLQRISSEISGGTTAAVALIHLKKLYVANVGDCRALLCKMDSSGNFKVIQISVDHDIRNEDELLRLSQLGLNIDKIRQVRMLGPQKNTRCIGNYFVKGGYKDFDILSAATQEPVIAEPSIRGGIPIDSSCQFLLLMSYGLYKTLEEATETQQVNQEIVNLVLEQFEVQTTLMGVAQAVVDRVVRIHHDIHMKNPKIITRRDDITLLVRNFNCPLGRQAFTIGSPSSKSTTEYPSTSNTFDSKINTQSSIDDGPILFGPRKTRIELPLDADGKIKPFVDFSSYFTRVEEDRKKGRLPRGYDF